MWITTRFGEFAFTILCAVLTEIVIMLGGISNETVPLHCELSTFFFPPKLILFMHKSKLKRNANFEDVIHKNREFANVISIFCSLITFFVVVVVWFLVRFVLLGCDDAARRWVTYHIIILFLGFSVMRGATHSYTLQKIRFSTVSFGLFRLRCGLEMTYRKKKC
jgi:hypothetical protein